jgi:hypothetical protein
LGKLASWQTGRSGSTQLITEDGLRVLAEKLQKA